MTFRISSVLALAVLPVVVGCTAAQNDDDTAASGQSEDAIMSAGAAPVYFNHTYGVISKATVTALQTNAWLASTFVDVELRTTVRPDLTYTGTYLNTRETYLEFFAEKEFFGSPVGVTGLGLGDEVTGGLQTVKTRWDAAYGANEVDPISLTSHAIDGAQVPWFNQTGPKWADASEFTGLWAMEYVPNAGSTAPRTRHEERAARYDASKLAQNVQAVFYGIPDADRANFEKGLRAVGWTILPLGADWIAVSPWDNGTRRVLHVQPASPGRTGVLGIVWRLNRFAAHVEQLGDATLKVGLFGRPYAMLWLVPPTAHDEAVAASQAD